MINERKIDLYNELTKLDNKDNEYNFLTSIEYKLKYGNILLENLLELDKNNIKFKVLEGYIDKSFYVLPLFNTFEACTIQLQNEVEISVLEKIFKNIIIEKHKSKKNVIYLFIDNKGEDE